jgi:hypothetical protein
MRTCKESDPGAFGSVLELRRTALTWLIAVGIQTLLPSIATATKPKLPPITFEEKAQISTFVVLGEVERVDFIETTRDGRKRVLDHVPERAIYEGVLSIRIVEALKWPQGIASDSTVKVIYYEGSTNNQFVDRFRPGSRWILFLRPSEGHLKSDPEKFFGTSLVLRVPSKRGPASPEPPERLHDAKQAIKEAKRSN